METTTLKFTLCVFVSFLTNSETLALFALCPAVEEGKDNSLVFSGTYENDSFQSEYAVYKDDTVIAKCVNGTSCDNYFPRHYKAHIFANNTRQELTEIRLRVDIRNVSRPNSEGIGNNWYVVHNGSISSDCTVQVYVVTKIIDCVKYVIKDDIYINCWMAKLFPKGQCHVYIKTSEMNGNKTYIEAKVTNDEISTDPTYYSTHCAFYLPKLYISPVKIEVWIIVYPNITGRDYLDFNFGFTKMIGVVSDNPSVVLRDCPEIVDENTELICYCDISEESIAYYPPRWFENLSSEIIAVSNGSNILRVNANRKNRSSFICTAIKLESVTNVDPVLLYTPIIIAKVHSINCESSLLEDTYSLTCQADKVYPSPRCTFQLNYIQEIQRREASFLKNEQILSDETYYKSTCVLYIEKNKIRGLGFLNVYVQMYPNVTGRDSDVKFGINKSVLFSKVDEAAGSSQFNRLIIMVYCIIGGIGCIIIIFILFIFYKYKEICIDCADNKKSHNSYDEINDGYILATNSEYKLDGQDDLNGYRKCESTIQNAAYEREIEIPSANNDYEMVDNEMQQQIYNEQNPVDNQNVQNISH